MDSKSALTTRCSGLALNGVLPECRGGREPLIANVRAHEPVPDELHNRIAKSGLRWFAIVPAMIGSWALAAALGGGVLKVAVRVCPPEMLVSSVCTAPWYRDLEHAVVFGWAALAGALTVTVSAVIAPSYRGAVATVTFVAVLAMFLPMAYALGWRASVGAISAGAVSWVWVLWWERRRVRSNTAVEGDATVPALRASARAPQRGR